MPHHRQHFRPERVEGGPDTRLDGHQIVGWDMFLERGAPTTIFAPVVRSEGEMVHARNRVYCFQCRTWIQGSEETDAIPAQGRQQMAGGGGGRERAGEVGQRLGLGGER
jgi:hypothetical protein